MTDDTDESTGASGIGRREYLAGTVLAAAGLAGCSSSEGGESTGTGGQTPTDTAAGTPTEMEPSPTRSPESLTRAFYSRLYGEDDVEGTNALYHPESPSPPLEAENFEAFGGLENIHTDVRSTTVVSQGGGRATVYADVEYTLPETTNVATDYLYLRQADDEWRVDSWLPEALRRRFATGTVEQFYDTLYNQNDIEAANAMYHPDSSSGPLEASSFDPYGGLENIETTVLSTELVSEGDGEAEVHAEVEYTTPDGTNTATDYVFLELYQGRWKVDQWLPEAVRESENETG